eukprot:6199233-Pleurochrysis_carterae.AAC.3
MAPPSVRRTAKLHMSFGNEETTRHPSSGPRGSNATARATARRRVRCARDRICSTCAPHTSPRACDTTSPHQTTPHQQALSRTLFASKPIKVRMLVSGFCCGKWFVWDTRQAHITFPPDSHNDPFALLARQKERRHYMRLGIFKGCLLLLREQVIPYGYITQAPAMSRVSLMPACCQMVCRPFLWASRPTAS